MSSKTVRFRGDDSKSSKGRYLDQHTDSGVDSFDSFDSESEGNAGKRPYHPDRNLYYDESEQKNKWIEKADQLDNLLIRAHKELNETRARMRGLEDYLGELQVENTELSRTNRMLEDVNIQLREYLKEMKLHADSKWSSQRKTAGATMTHSMYVGAETVPSVVSSIGEGRPWRKAAKRLEVCEGSNKEKEREPIRREMEQEIERLEDREKEEQMDRLRKRFAPVEGNDDDARTSNDSTSSSRSRSSAMSDDTHITDPDDHPRLQQYHAMPPLPLRTHQASVSSIVVYKEKEEAKGGRNSTSDTGSSRVDISPLIDLAEQASELDSGSPRRQSVPEGPKRPTETSIKPIQLPQSESGIDGQTDGGEPASPEVDSGHQGETDSADSADSRAPSPWQEIGSPEAERSVAIATWWILNRLGGEARRLQPGAASPSSSVSAEGVVSCASGSGAGSDAASFTDADASSSHPASPAAGQAQPNSKRARDANDRAGESENEDDRRNGKRINIAASDERLARPRFACPYQKYDPLGSPFCCMPNNKNPEGGADTFARIKSHVFRSHDPFTRCPTCWKACKTKEEALEHSDAVQCIKKASPGKYWMTRQQCNQVRGQKFMSNSVDNWFCLYNILLPDDIIVDRGANRRLSPCR